MSATAQLVFDAKLLPLERVARIMAGAVPLTAALFGGISGTFIVLALITSIYPFVTAVAGRGWFVSRRHVHHVEVPAFSVQASHATRRSTLAKWPEDRSSPPASNAMAR